MRQKCIADTVPVCSRQQARQQYPHEDDFDGIEEIERLEKVDIQNVPVEFLNRHFKHIEGLCERHAGAGAADWCIRPGYLRARRLLSNTLELVCAKYPENAVDHHHEKRVWTVLTKELNAVGVPKPPPSAEEPGKEVPPEDEKAETYFKLCEEAEGVFRSCFNVLQEKHAPMDSALVHENRVRMLAERLLLFVGDIMRYKAKARGKGKDPAALKEIANYYLRAKTIYPFEGKTYNQLALTLGASGDAFGCIYYYVRCVFCRHPFDSALESLVKHFDKIRLKYNELAQTWAHPAMTKVPQGHAKPKKDEEQLRATRSDFVISFLRLIGIVYTKIDREECPKVLYNLGSKLRSYLKYVKTITERAERTVHVELLANVATLLIFAIHYSIVGPVQKPEKSSSPKKEPEEGSSDSSSSSKPLSTNFSNMRILGSAKLPTMPENLSATSKQQEEDKELLRAVTEEPKIPHPAGLYWNKQALETDTGLISLRAFAEILSQLCSAVDPSKEDTYSVVLPVCYWLSLNPDVRTHIWAKHVELRRALTRIYFDMAAVVSGFAEAGKAEECLKKMLSDDYQLVGFVPLDDKILKKDTSAKQRVEEKDEGRIRMVAVHTMLAEIGCTDKSVLFPPRRTHVVGHHHEAVGGGEKAPRHNGLQRNRPTGCGADRAGGPDGFCRPVLHAEADQTAHHPRPAKCRHASRQRHLLLQRHRDRGQFLDQQGL